MTPQHKPQSPSSTLLERLRVHDELAWQRLTHLLTSSIYRWIRKGGVPECNAPDLVQDVFIEIARSLHRFQRERKEDSFTGWLRVITHRRVLHYHRQGEPEPIGGSKTHWIFLHVSAPTPEEDFTDDPKMDMLRHGLDLVRDEFEPRTWDAFEAVSMKGRDPNDVATELGMSVGAVYIAKSRVLKRLRRELEGLM